MDQDDNDAALAQQQLEEQEQLMSLHTKLAAIQQKINAPKGQHNKFGGYYYRSCEDILQAVKPLLGELTLTITDEIVPVADRIYVKATATITDGRERIHTTAYAREELSKKGMDASQITGSTSSYARKYALNGLLLIDDAKDADATNDHGKRETGASSVNIAETLSAIKSAATEEALKGVFAQAWAAANEKQRAPIKKAYDERKAQLESEKVEV